MFKNEPLRNRVALYGIVAAVFLFAVLVAFYSGIDYQKRNGPPGRECKESTYRQPEEQGGAAMCVNGYWFDLVPPNFPPPESKK